MSEFDRAVQFERDVQAVTRAVAEENGEVYPVPFLTAARVPLDTIDFETPAPADPQLRLFEGNGFGNECEGMCGL